jgi:hypothetical protein
MICEYFLFQHNMTSYSHKLPFLLVEFDMEKLNNLLDTWVLNQKIYYYDIVCIVHCTHSWPQGMLQHFANGKYASPNCDEFHTL